MSADFLNPTTLSSNAIREYAQKIGHYHNIYSPEGRADVRKLLESLGGTFRPKDETYLLIVEEPKNFSISIPSGISDRRKTLHIARAIGFYALLHLHPQLNHPLVVSASNVPETTAVQANIFSSALLIPKEQFLTQWNEYRHTLNWTDTVGDIFNVSPRAVETRAIQLADGEGKA